MTIHVCVIMNKCGITATPTQLVVTASDWRTPREIVVASEPDSELRTIQIHHKIYETYDDVYNSSTVIPSLFVSVLQKEATFLFSFGCGIYGRLGTSDEENAFAPVPFSCKWMHPVQIACGKAHSAIIDVYSNIYCFGLGTAGQLGQGGSRLDSSRIPLRVPAIGPVPVLLVSCGSHHTMCMTAEGRVFAWGDNTFGQLGLGAKSPKPRGTPTRVDKVVNVRHIVCGGCHSFIITQDSNVLACGSNIAGQLGLGDRVDRAAFERVPFFRRLFSQGLAPPTGSSSAASLNSLIAPSTSGKNGGFTMPDMIGPNEIELACGIYHSVALCGKRVYAWGNGDDGRLGLGHLETCLEPALLPSLQDVPIKSIACGGSHSGAITVSGDVYTWGNGQYGQLGIGSVRSRKVPTKVRLLSGKAISQLSFGEWHSMALTQDGTLYAWGFGEEGQLGLPDEDRRQQHQYAGFQHENSRIALFPTIVHSLSGMGATSVRCGGSHTFVVSVLENRRQHIVARLHRRASHSAILSESTRLRVQRRTRILDGGSPVRRDNEQQPTDSELPTQPEQVEPPAPFKRRETPMKPRPPRCNSARSAEVASELAADARAFKWKERPLSSRTAVRNAMQQEIKEIAQVKEMLSPRPRPPANAFISPRMRRLHRQIVQSSETGVTTHKHEGFVSSEGQISEAVQQATQEYVRGGSGCVTIAATPGRSESQWDAALICAINDLRGEEEAADDGAMSKSSDESEILVPTIAWLRLEDDIRVRSLRS